MEMKIEENLAMARCNVGLQILSSFVVSIWLIRNQANSSVSQAQKSFGFKINFEVSHLRLFCSATQHGNPASEDLPFNTNERDDRSFTALRVIGTYASTWFHIQQKICC